MGLAPVIPQIYYGTVESHKNDTTISVSIGSGNLFDYLDAEICNTTLPPIKSYGMVLYDGSSKYIWLGILGSNKQNTIVQSSSNKATTVIDDNNIVNRVENNVISLTKDGLNASVAGSLFRHTKSGIAFEYFNSSKSKTTVVGFGQDGNINISTVGSTTFACNSQLQMFVGNHGNLIVAGGIDSTSKKQNSPDSLIPLNNVFVKTNGINVNAGSGLYQMSAGGVKIKISSGKFSGGGNIPGKGPKESYSLEVIEGDLIQQVGVGDIHLIANNMLKKNTIYIRNGSKKLPIQTGVTLKAMSAELYQTTVPGIGASVKATNAMVTISATKNITVNSKIGQVNLSSKTGMKLTTLTQLQIQALQIKMQAKAIAQLEAKILKINAKMMTISATMLDLSGAKTVNMGPKTVTPGPGPLCALVVCPMSGALHTGSICQG